MRSFIVNKIPVILEILFAQAFQSVSAEISISEALAQIDPNTFPSFSQSFDMMSGVDSLADVRQDFLFACALYQLIPEESIERLLGEPPMSALPSAGRYNTEELISQCSGKVERMEELIGELDCMNGNAGAIVGALVEVRRFFLLIKLANIQTRL